MILVTLSWDKSSLFQVASRTGWICLPVLQGGLMGAQDWTSELLTEHFPTSYLLESAVITMAKGKKIKKKTQDKYLILLTGSKFAQSCILKDLGSPPWSWGTAHLQVHWLQGFVYCYVQGGDEMCFKICMFKEATVCTSIKRKGLLCASWRWTLMQNNHQSKFQALVNLPLTVLIGRCYTIPNQNALIS